MMRDFVMRVIEAGNILAAKQSGRVAMALSANGVLLEQRWETAPSEMSLIDPSSIWASG